MEIERLPILTGLPPLINNQSRVLVLGSFPSVLSLEGQCYYGHPRNHFWPILQAVFGEMPPPTWPERGDWVLSHKIAIWDVIGSCKRKGSLDQAIQEPIPNDIPSLLIKYPLIQRILLNGGTSATLFQRHILPTIPEWSFAEDQRTYRVYRLPSTSPIPTRTCKCATDKLPQWQNALYVDC